MRYTGFGGSWLLLCWIALQASGMPASDSGDLKVRLSWGHRSPSARPYYVKLVPADSAIQVLNASGDSLEPGDGFKEGAWQTTAGQGDVDGVTLTLRYSSKSSTRIQNLHIIWADLIAQSDAETARRLSQDAAFHPGCPKLEIQLNAAGTAGFSLTVDQLLNNRALWVPAQDVFVTAGDSPPTFADHQAELERWRGSSVLDRVKVEPEATYEQFASLWEDMGSPGYRHPRAPEPGHIVCLTWDSAISKFGIDRAGGVWNDLGNPDRFRFWFEFGDLTKGVERSCWTTTRSCSDKPFQGNGCRTERRSRSNGLRPTMEDSQ